MFFILQKDFFFALQTRVIVYLVLEGGGGLVCARVNFCNMNQCINRGFCLCKWSCSCGW